MSRVVIDVHPDVEQGGFYLVLSEPRTNEGWAPRRFAYRPEDPVPASFVAGTADTSAMGAYLVEGLRSHPAIGKELDKLLLAAANASPSPVFIRMSAEAEALPWETLFDQNEFLALDRRWPVARIGGDSGLVSADFEPPLRIMAILGAAKVHAAEEWDALFGALKGARFPIALKALVAEASVEAQAKAAAAADSNVTVIAGGIPPGRDVLREVEDFRPHLLHFFSHGRVNHGFPEIQVATRSSWPNDDDPGHIILEPKAFATLAALQAPWVVTMNVCRGAKAGGTGSLAFSLLTIGFPAVAGMREPVGERVAHAFAKGFYRSIVQNLNRAEAGGERVDLDLASALLEPRMEICDAIRELPSCREAAPIQREWTLPVLYIREGGIAITRRDPAPIPPPIVLDVPDDAMAAPAYEVTPEEAENARTVLENKLLFLRDLISANLPGMDDNATRTIKGEIQRLETELYAKLQHAPA
jgi:CHAT domain-containing protein